MLVEDAKSYFARPGKRCDVIISEPSNPWVNGVASLFTTEFYRDTRRHFAPDGLFVQWLQLYEFNDRLLGSIPSALGENFAAYEAYATNNADLVVVAVATERVPRPALTPTREPAFLEQLNRIGIADIEELTNCRLGTKRQFAPLLAPLLAPVNSGFSPFVQLQAPRARFAQAIARASFDLALAPIPIVEMIGSIEPVFLRRPAAPFIASYRTRTQSTGLTLARELLDGAADPLRLDDARVRCCPMRKYCSKLPTTTGNKRVDSFCYLLPWSARRLRVKNQQYRSFGTPMAARCIRAARPPPHVICVVNPH